jgi:hypothetical protein
MLALDRIASLISLVKTAPTQDQRRVDGGLAKSGFSWFHQSR